eukprot:13369616-Ditylum_brightwellii.AAC.1
MKYKKKNDVVPDFSTSSGWIDGAVDQLAAILNDEVLDEYFENKMIKNKQSAARTGSEQASDTGDPYKDIKKLEKETMIDDIPNDS